MILEAQREAATKAVKDVTDVTRDYGTKAVDYTKDLGDKAVGYTKDSTDKATVFAKDTSDQVVTFTKDTGDKVLTFTKDTSGQIVTFTKDTGDQVVTFTKDTSDKAVEIFPFLEMISDYLESLFESGKEATVKGVDSVKEFQVGEKNVAEHAQATVDTVSDAIDVEQLQDQVTKLRHQMEGVLQSWAESFRPSTSPVEEVTTTVEKAAEKTVKKASKALDEMTKADLLEMARKKDIKGRSSMNKQQLIDALS